MSLHQAQLLRQWSDDVVFFAALAGDLDEQTRRRLAARGIRIVEQAVVAVLGDGETVTGARLEDGSILEIDAIFTGGAPEPHDRMLALLGLARSEGPMGDLITVDPVGQTSNPRVWATGNVVNPAANVPLAMGSGSFAGAAVNAALVAREFDDAVARLSEQAREQATREQTAEVAS
jgi:thioredoxin reductase